LGEILSSISIDSSHDWLASLSDNRMVYFSGLGPDEYFRVYKEDPLIIIGLIAAIFIFKDLFCRFISEPLTKINGILDETKKKRFRQYLWRTTFYIFATLMEFSIIIEKDWFYDVSIAIKDGGSKCSEEE
jgi:hypothetical protein